jgi:hypothetical protein
MRMGECMTEETARRSPELYEDPQIRLGPSAAVEASMRVGPGTEIGYDIFPSVGCGHTGFAGCRLIPANRKACKMTFEQ